MKFATLLLLVASCFGATSPSIVSKISRPNQTACLPTATLWIPQQDGLFRITAAGDADQTNPPDALIVNWTNDQGQQKSASILQFTTSNPQQVFVIRALANIPITYTTGTCSGTSGYNFWVTLELLQ